MVNLLLKDQLTNMDRLCQLTRESQNLCQSYSNICCRKLENNQMSRNWCLAVKTQLLLFLENQI